MFYLKYIPFRPLDLAIHKAALGNRFKNLSWIRSIYISHLSNRRKHKSGALQICPGKTFSGSRDWGSDRDGTGVHMLLPGGSCQDNKTVINDKQFLSLACQGLDYHSTPPKAPCCLFLNVRKDMKFLSTCWQRHSSGELLNVYALSFVNLSILKLPSFQGKNTTIVCW